MIGFDGWQLRFSVANALGCLSSVVGCDLLRSAFSHGKLRLITMPGAEISALPMGICALVVGVLKAPEFPSWVWDQNWHITWVGQNWTVGSAACVLASCFSLYISFCGQISKAKKHNIYIYIHIYIFACTLGDLFLCMSWVRSLLIKLELRDGLRWCCWSWCVLGPNQFLHPSTRWEDGPMESLGLYR